MDDRTSKIMNELETVKSNSYNLISLYMPKNRSVLDVISQLRVEKGIVEHVRDAKLQDELQSALDMLIDRLKGFDSMPDTGLAMFCGHYGGDNAIRLHVYRPEEKPIDFSLFRCDNHFTVRI